MKRRINVSAAILISVAVGLLDVLFGLPPLLLVAEEGDASTAGEEGAADVGDATGDSTAAPSVDIARASRGGDAVIRGDECTLAAAALLVVVDDDDDDEEAAADVPPP